jgi:hypothetical protein
MGFDLSAAEARGHHVKCFNQHRVWHLFREVLWVLSSTNDDELHVLLHCGRRVSVQNKLGTRDYSEYLEDIQRDE